MELVRQIFKDFFETYNFSECGGRFKENFCVKNNDIHLEYIFDYRYNEISIIIYKSVNGAYKNILDIIELLSTFKSRDIFQSLTEEYNNLHISLISKKMELGHLPNSLILLSICSMCIKNYAEILTLIEQSLND